MGFGSGESIGGQGARAHDASVILVLTGQTASPPELGSQETGFACIGNVLEFKADRWYWHRTSPYELTFQ